jgi:hypothetical protein
MYENFNTWLKFIDVTILWTMYTIILLESFDFLWQTYGRKIYYDYNFYNFGTNLDIITIIIFYFCILKLNCT